MTEPSQVRYGTLGRAHGLKGEIRFFPLHPDSDRVQALRDVELRSGTERRAARVTGVRRGSNAWLLRIDGVRFRDQAEALVGHEVWVPESLFPAPDDDEYYGYQLEGLAVVDAEGKRIGEVLALVDFGAGDLLEVRVGGQDIYVPFAAPYVGEVDLDGRTIEVDVQDWLLA